MNIVYITPTVFNLKGTKGGKPNKKKKLKVEKFAKETSNPNSRENVAPKKRKKSHLLKNPLMQNHIQDNFEYFYTSTSPTRVWGVQASVRENQ